MTESSFIL